LFPFLIGRIRTKEETVEELIGEKFPFLIGRIRTFTGRRRYTMKRYLFPFLIGRIRTS